MTSSVETAARESTRPSWVAIPRADSETFARAREQALNLVQWPARIANSFVREDQGEARVLMAFRPDNATLVTQAFEDLKSLELRLETLELQFLENGKPEPHIFNPEEHSPAETEAWLLVELLHRGIDRERFSKKLPYSVDGLMSGDADDYSPETCRDGLRQLAVWFSNAADALEAAGGTAPIICRPQSLTLARRAGTHAEIGFSPGDAQNQEPYFYRTGDGKRTTLKASALLAESDPHAAAVRFLSASGI